MKTLALIFATGLGFLTNTHAAEPAKTLVQLTVKKQVLDTDNESLGRQLRTKQKTYTLRVVIFNNSSKPVEESVLSGIALVSRAGELKEQIVKESLGEIKVPAMKPNEKLTLDLGKIELSEVEWEKRKFEEDLEEWQVVCKMGEVEIGKAESSVHYVFVAKDAVTHDKLGRDPAKPGRKIFPRR